MTVSVFAPAKINLTLHVTRQRHDGYHLIDSLVSFAPVGDQIIISDAPVSSLVVEGPEAEGVPTGMGNLVLQVAEIMAPGRGLAITLKKNLPVASGIGGGSTDAAAVIRTLLDVGDTDAEYERIMSLDEDALGNKYSAIIENVFTLGADIMMCVLPGPQRVRGIGNKCDAIELPSLPALLVNPRIAVSTRDVFKALEQKELPPMAQVIPTFARASEFINWLALQRNDLETPAFEICPEICDVLKVLEKLDGCLLARMSGSGATCFVLFDNLELARAAQKKVRFDYPAWWVSEGKLGDWIEKSAPVFS